MREGVNFAINKLLKINQNSVPFVVCLKIFLSDTWVYGK